MQGLGTIDNPYIVTTPEEYKSISKAPSACYKLGNDIDMSSSPGLACTIFSGTFDGNGHRITGQTGNLQSAFCRYLTNGAVVKNVGFALNLNCTTGRSTGGVAAEVSGNCTIQKVWIEPAIPGTIAYVRSTASNPDYRPYVGGIVGRVTNGVVLIEDCYLADYVQVMATDLSTTAPYSPARAGGAVGSYEGGTLTLRRFYKVRLVTAAGMYSTPSSDQILYKAGSTAPITQDNFFNFDYFEGTSPYGTGKTTAQMQSQATYTTWDFVNTWQISAGNYPTLKFAPPTLIENRNIKSFVQNIISKNTIAVGYNLKGLVGNINSKIEVILPSAGEVRNLNSFVEKISAQAISLGEIIITLNSKVENLESNVIAIGFQVVPLNTTITSYMDKISKGALVLNSLNSNYQADVLLSKTINSYMDNVNKGIMVLNKFNNTPDAQLSSVIISHMDNFKKGILVDGSSVANFNVKSYVNPIIAKAFLNHEFYLKSSVGQINSKVSTAIAKILELQSFVEQINAKADIFRSAETRQVQSWIDEIFTEVVIAALSNHIVELNSWIGDIESHLKYDIPGIKSKVKAEKGIGIITISPRHHYVEIKSSAPMTKITTQQSKVISNISKGKAIISIKEG